MNAFWRSVSDGAIRTLGFLVKEVVAVLRQPLLIASLVLGPFAILIVFGLGYRGPQPELRTILVVPDDPTIARYVDVYREGLGGVFRLQQVLQDEEQARAELRAGRADVVVIVPTDAYEQIISGDQATLRLLYAETDPTSNGWVRYFAYVQTSEINRRILLEFVRQSKGPASQTLEATAEMRAELSRLEADLMGGDDASAAARSERLLQTVRSIRDGQARALDRLSGATDAASAAGVGRATQALLDIEAELDSLERDIVASRGMREQALRQAEDVRAYIVEFEALAQQINNIPPETLVSPLVASTHNIAPIEPSAVSFFTPAVMALLLQHIGVTLSSMSAVRDRLLGSLELFRVSPVGARHIILGKSLGFGVLLAVVGAALTWATLSFLGVPILGNVVLYWVAIGLVIFDAVALGFALSVIAKNESQAVQLSMLVLLTSVFLGGFFLPLSLMLPWVRTASYFLPASYGAASLRDVMLQGAAPTLTQMVGPLLLGIGFYAVASLGLWREMRQA